jgi:tRNA (cmo5U34)-methyltransferase
MTHQFLADNENDLVALTQLLEHNPFNTTTRYTKRSHTQLAGATEVAMKSSVDDIRRRFDADVERFSNLETGQSATVDAPLAMALVAQAAAVTAPHARHVLDVGCGAGNYTLKLLEHLPNLDATLIDLSRPMLDRANERVGRATAGTVTTIQGDIREITLGARQFDIVLAAAVLHHLRTDEEWRSVFTALHTALRPGGSLWVFDLVESAIPAVQRLMWERYGEYLTALKDAAYRDHVFAYVEKEDTPRPLTFQLDLLREIGFAQVEVLHKNVCFAAFGALKVG